MMQRDANEIDRVLLSKILDDMDVHLMNPNAICAIGGTALMLLGFKTASMDVDLIPLGNKNEIESAISSTIDNARHGKIAVTITENGAIKEKFPVKRNLVIQTFGSKLPLEKSGEFLILPGDFTEHMHLVKSVPWILPEGGKKINIATKKKFHNLKIYALGPADLICTKIFMPRQKDVEDIEGLFSKINVSMRYFGSKKKLFLERFLKFFYTNEKNTKVAISGLKFYISPKTYRRDFLA